MVICSASCVTHCTSSLQNGGHWPRTQFWKVGSEWPELISVGHSLSSYCWETCRWWNWSKDISHGLEDGFSLDAKRKHAALTGSLGQNYCTEEGEAERKRVLSKQHLNLLYHLKLKSKPIKTLYCLSQFEFLLHATQASYLTLPTRQLTYLFC